MTTTTLISRIPKRYLVTAMMFFGAMMACLQRTCLSIALVEMTSNKNSTTGNTTDIVKAEYDYWTTVVRSQIISIFTVGSFFTFCLGPVVIKLGGVTSFGIAVGVQGLISMSLPVFLHIHLYLFMLGRAIQGLLLGMSTIGIIDTLTHWAPANERSRLASWYFLGFSAGVAVNYPLFGYIAYYQGWRAIFYTAGCVALIWSILWLYFVSNDPSDDKYISEKERTYLKNNVHVIREKAYDIPWKDIRTSKAVFALMNEYFVAAWSVTFVLFSIPFYVKDMYDVSVDQVGLISGIPSYGPIVILPLGAYLADRLRATKFGIARTHKLFICLGHVFGIIAVLIAALRADFMQSIICFTCLRLAHAVAESTYCVLPIDLAGQYSSVVKSFSLSAACVSDVLSQMVMGYMVADKSRYSWNMYFFLLSGIMIYGLVTFFIFGSGELQPWAAPVPQNSNADQKTDESSPSSMVYFENEDTQC